MTAAADFQTIRENQQAHHTYRISPDIYRKFLSAFEDANPIHVDEAHAQALGFQGTVMHAGILHGFISHFIGVRFPGPNALLQSVNIQYKSPTHLGDEIRIQATVIQKSDSVRTLVLELALMNLTRNQIAAIAKVQVGVL